MNGIKKDRPDRPTGQTGKLPMDNNSNLARSILKTELHMTGVKGSLSNFYRLTSPGVASGRE
jgi:hypothetical protein